MSILSGDFSTALMAGFGGLLFTLLLAMAIIDCHRFVLPDRLNAVLALGGVGQALLLGHPTLLDALAGSLVGFLALSVVAHLFRQARGVEGLGFGDQKFAAAAGLWLGWQQIAPMLLIASLSALAVVLVRSVRTGTFDRSLRLPFGPFLGVGTAACWLGVIAIPS
jgi:prepilin signal peptidase PulO-like enzyme (type II secretory pathway)